VSWDGSAGYGVANLERRVPERPLIVYVDVDDTLVRSFGSKQIPMSAVVDKIRGIASQPGVALYCWSSGGAAYARSVCERLGIAELFVTFLPKPNLLVDDQALNTWNLVVVHPNELADDTAAVRQRLGWEG
jgi:hypothetical protein